MVIKGSNSTGGSIIISPTAEGTHGMVMVAIVGGISNGTPTEVAINTVVLLLTHRLLSRVQIDHTIPVVVRSTQAIVVAVTTIARV